MRAVQILIDDPQIRQRIGFILEAMGETVVFVDAPTSGFLAADALHEKNQAEETLQQDALIEEVGAIITDLADLNTSCPVISLHPQARVSGNLVFTCAPPYLIKDLNQGLSNCSRLLLQQNYEWSKTSKESVQFPKLAGRNTLIEKMRELMGKVATKDITVLITGDSGTGKEVVARSLHEASYRCDGPFIPVNCGAIPGELLESELFGHEKGAFTGAVNAKQGRFELAEGGTLFLDEIGELPLPMQVKLLRVLQDRSFERVGGVETKVMNVRIVAATNRNLELMIKEGGFREDLYYRLNVFPLHVPALKDRIDDIAELVNRLTPEDGAKFDKGAMQVLENYTWPGNVRELANLLERMAIQHPGRWISETDLPERIRLGLTSVSEISIAPGLQASQEQASALLPVNGIDLKEYLGALEKGLIQQALDDTNSVVARAADRLHVRRTTLVEKMRKYGMQRP